MRVGNALVGMTLAEQPTVEKIGGGGDGKGPSSKKKKKRKQKKPTPAQEPPPSAIQRLYETCKEVFSDGSPGVVPSGADVERIRSILDGMKPEDVGLTHTLSFLENSFVGAPSVVYLHICGSDKFSIGIFCLRPGAVIPLHNHPGMTVFSKLLFGSMHIKSYDWEENQNSNHEPGQSACPTGARLAKVVIDAVFTTPCDTSILYPTAGGNMHCFTAVTSCAVLDVLGPDYCDSEGRHCAYYNVLQYSRLSGEGNTTTSSNGEYAWLEETEKPDSFVVGGARYTGPQIIDG